MVSAEALLSLFENFTAGARVPFRVDISAVVIVGDGFFDGLSRLSIPLLIGLHLNGHTFSELDQRRLVEFVSQNRQLRELSLIDSITPASLPLLDGLAGVRTLTHLAIAARSAPPGLRELRPTLLRLMRNNKLEFLDISGQPIDERTILALLTAGLALKEFYFDRTDVSSGEALNAVCRRVLAHPKLTFSAYPDGLLTPAMIRSPLLERLRLQRDAAAIREEFSARFRGREASGYSPQGTAFMAHAAEILRSDVAEREARPVVRAAPPLPPMAESFTAMADFVQYPADITALLAECGDVPGVDPMLEVFREVSAAIDVAFLADRLVVA
jgi:hypothetical protein